MMRSASRNGRGAAVAGIDQQRLARRRDEQRRVAALDVDDVDVQRLARLAVSLSGAPLEMRARVRYAHRV